MISIADRERDMPPGPVSGVLSTTPRTRYESPSFNAPIVPSIRWASVPWFVTQICSIPGFSDRIIFRAAITHRGLSPRIPKRTGSGVCGTQTTTSFTRSTVSHVCGNVASSAANRLARSTDRGVPNRPGSRYTRISEVRSSSLLATAAVAPIRPRRFFQPRYRRRPHREFLRPLRSHRSLLLPSHRMPGQVAGQQ